jgi:hypothetical protein
MRILRYLHGNYVRCLIRRHHVLSSSALEKDAEDSFLAVNAAQDSIRAIVDLHNNGDLYVRQQVAYTFFLANSVSILLLTVCHAPCPVRSLMSSRLLRCH